MVVERNNLLTEKLPYPTGAMKRVYKLPIMLYRMGLGPLVGKLFMILTTRGRKSGLPRHTAIEYHTYNGRKYAMVGWSQSDWYKNILADPLVTIQTATGTESVKVRALVTDEEYLEAWELAEHDPVVQGMIKMSGMDLTRESFLAQKDRFVILTFDPIDEPTPAPVEPDLKWVPRAVVNIAVNALVAMAIRRFIKNRRAARAEQHEALPAGEVNGVRPYVKRRR
ncbi:MAG: nitroreductase family deazaflavin-dependent oxidoreductase [Chloroflexi bacterium]|nr:nitroreductase family deazaflavin-dependent oxidoreductase [Chloroflexota bacterium]